MILLTSRQDIKFELSRYNQLHDMAHYMDLCLITKKEGKSHLSLLKKSLLPSLCWFCQTFWSPHQWFQGSLYYKYLRHTKYSLGTCRCLSPRYLPFTGRTAPLPTANSLKAFSGSYHLLCIHMDQIRSYWGITISLRLILDQTDWTPGLQTLGLDNWCMLYMALQRS